MVAVGLVLALIGAVLGAAGLSYNAAQTPILADIPGSSTVYYSDGTVLAHLSGRRTIPLPYAEFSPTVTDAAVAAQDPDFWADSGGALTRAVVRIGTDSQQSPSVQGKARLWVATRKLDGALTKNQILEYFLNAVPLGRNTFGVEAAAQVYFGKTARRGASPQASLTTSEAITLMSILDAPSTFDPSGNAATLANSQRRWVQIRDTMKSKGWLSESAAAALTYPAGIRTDGPNTWPNGADTPAGLVVPQVMSELATMPPFKGKSWDALKTAGLDIYTTIAPPAQRLLEHAADETQTDSVMSGQPPTLQAAAVVIEPGTGRVLAYYGGHDAAGADFAGTYVDADGVRAGFGAHPPGSAFGVHVVAAALKAGISVQSRWQATTVDMLGRTGANAVRNFSVCPTPCTLAAATTAGVNTAMYAVGLSVGPNRVIDAARDAGVTALYTPDRTRVELTPTTSGAQLVPSTFDTDISLGTYPVTVLDEATAMATYAHGGLAVRPHFVQKVVRGGVVVAAETPPGPGQKAILNPGAAADLTWTLSQSPVGKLSNGWDSAAHAGFYSPNPLGTPTDAWTIGYTTRLAVAVWVGNRRDVVPLRDSQGFSVFGSGLPAQIYRAFMNPAPDALGLTRTPADSFPAPANVGVEHPVGSTG